MSNAFARFDLTGKTALVTGGATGMGYHIARALARSGARVMIAARRENLLKAAADRLNEDPLINGRVTWHPVDLADRASTKALADHASKTMGGVDIYVGNAAIPGYCPVDALTDESIDTMQRVNVTANIELVRAFLPHMRSKKWGRIIFISSAGSTIAPALEGLSMYGAAKAALESFARVVAAETGRDAITANSLVLGAFRTEMYQETFDMLEKQDGPGAGKAFSNAIACMTALGHVGEPDDIEGAIQLLASDAGRYITGASIPVDAGMLIMMRPNPVVD